MTDEQKMKNVYEYSLTTAYAVNRKKWDSLFFWDSIFESNPELSKLSRVSIAISSFGSEAVIFTPSEKGLRHGLLNYSIRERLPCSRLAVLSVRDVRDGWIEFILVAIYPNSSFEYHRSNDDLAVECDGVSVGKVVVPEEFSIEEHLVSGIKTRIFYEFCATDEGTAFVWSNDRDGLDIAKSPQAKYSVISRTPIHSFDPEKNAIERISAVLDPKTLLCIGVISEKPLKRNKHGETPDVMIERVIGNDNSTARRLFLKISKPVIFSEDIPFAYSIVEYPNLVRFLKYDVFPKYDDYRGILGLSSNIHATNIGFIFDEEFAGTLNYLASVPTTYYIDSRINVLDERELSVDNGESTVNHQLYFLGVGSTIDNVCLFRFTKEMVVCDIANKPFMVPKDPRLRRHIRLSMLVISKEGTSINGELSTTPLSSTIFSIISNISIDGENVYFVDGDEEKQLIGTIVKENETDLSSKLGAIPSSVLADFIHSENGEIHRWILRSKEGFISHKNWRGHPISLSNDISEFNPWWDVVESLTGVFSRDGKFVGVATSKEFETKGTFPDGKIIYDHPNGMPTRFFKIKDSKFDDDSSLPLLCMTRMTNPQFITISESLFIAPEHQKSIGGSND